MPASEAQIRANQRNCAHSTGPRTSEGKENSRANSLKHGLTGAGIVLPEADAAEVRRRAAAFAAETNASGDIGHALARRAALSSVRMERGADQQTAALSEHVRKVEADFVPPEGVDDVEAARLRTEAVRRAMFDPSREAVLARKYEAAAERGFFRALNADFRGRENNQTFWSRKPRFLGEFAISALESLIVYPARNDSIGIKSTLAVSCMSR
jgi:hypothetical protein